MAERTLDLVAASRIARRVNLSDVHVVELSATRHGGPKDSIKPQLTDAYEVNRIEDKLQVLCRHHLDAASADDRVAEIKVALRLVYEIVGTDPINENDLPAFADANGAYHSWPFIREIYNSITLRLGLPAFVLPTLFVVTPKQKPTPGIPSENGGEKQGGEDPDVKKETA